MASSEAQEKLIEFARQSSPREFSKRITRLMEDDDRWRSGCLNLNAAESVMSRAARASIVSDLYARSMPDSRGLQPHRGRRYYAEIETLAGEICEEVFGVKYAECRPATASTGEGVVIHALTNVGDPALCLEDARGHRTWNAEIGYSGMRGLKIHEIPFDDKTWSVDTSRLAEQAKKIGRGSLIIVGTPYPLFPISLRELKDVAEDRKARLWFDGAHVLGLIAGGQFQNPSKEGAEIITGSTQKTLSGPVGGVILTNSDQVQERVERYFTGHFSVFGNSRIVALAITLAEWREFGRSFASQMVANARALAEALDDCGFDVLAKERGFTRSHMVIADLAHVGNGLELIEKLESANIITSAFKLHGPSDTYSGLRLGVTEMTRYGMKEREMRLTAELISKVVIEGVSPARIRKEVTEMRKAYRTVRYCFEYP